MNEPIIIIGAGLAGYQLAKEFRKNDTDTPLLIVTADQGLFYSKPQLSTALTSGKTAETLPTATSEQMAQQLKAVIKTKTTVESINCKEKTIHTIDGETFSYKKLVLAVGATTLKAHIEGSGAAEVLSINHIYHYSQFRDLIRDKKNIAIMGAGLIGCEFANDLSNAGYQVDVIALSPTPLELLVPESIGKQLQLSLEKNHVHFHLNCTVKKVEKISDRFELLISNGTTLKTDFVLSAIGLKPHVALAIRAELKVDRGILVNRYLQTSEPDIFALGDCAEVEGHVLPYITPLLNCSRALGKTLAGQMTAVDYPAMPVVVKTPIHPIVVCPPPKSCQGTWQVETVADSMRALFYDENNVLQGFVLTNQAVKERMELTKQIPPLF